MGYYMIVTICPDRNGTTYPNLSFSIQQNIDRQPVHISFQIKCVIIIKYRKNNIQKNNHISVTYMYNNTSDLYNEIFIFNNENQENIHSVF